jgi:hypothetical protein
LEEKLLAFFVLKMLLFGLLGLCQFSCVRLPSSHHDSLDGQPRVSVGRAVHRRHHSSSQQEVDYVGCHPCMDRRYCTDACCLEYAYSYFPFCCRTTTNAPVVKESFPQSRSRSWQAAQNRFYKLAKVPCLVVRFGAHNATSVGPHGLSRNPRQPGRRPAALPA